MKIARSCCDELLTTGGAMKEQLRALVSLVQIVTLRGVVCRSHLKRVFLLYAAQLAVSIFLSCVDSCIWFVERKCSSVSCIYFKKNRPAALPSMLPFRSFCHVLTVLVELLRACYLAYRASCRLDFSVMRGSLQLVCRVLVQ